jgi:hypothetical protein
MLSFVQHLHFFPAVVSIEDRRHSDHTLCTRTLSFSGVFRRFDRTLYIIVVLVLVLVPGQDLTGQDSKKKGDRHGIGFLGIWDDRGGGPDIPFPDVPQGSCGTN